MGEKEYLNLLEKVLKTGVEKNDRTNVGTISSFGEKIEFDISTTIPLLTTKKIFWKSIVKELLWFISGSSSVNILQEQGVNFWDGNTSREFLDNNKLFHFEEGELGAGYGWNWRHFGEEYKGVSKNYKGVDQLEKAIELLKTDPFSRRIIVTAWNPSQIHNVALPPCHHTFQFNVTEIDGIKYLDCMLMMRSNDLFLGCPFNIASYSILTYMVAHIVGMKPRKYIHVIGDAHIYKNHKEAVSIQLTREPLGFPTLFFTRNVKNIDDFKLEDFEIKNYKNHPYIKANMAI